MYFPKGRSGREVFKTDRDTPTKVGRGRSSEEDILRIGTAQFLIVRQEAEFGGLIVGAGDAALRGARVATGIGYGPGTDELLLTGTTSG